MIGLGREGATADARTSVLLRRDCLDGFVETSGLEFESMVVAKTDSEETDRLKGGGERPVT